VAADQPKPPTLLYAGFDLLTGGIDSGIAPISLPANKVAFSTNATVRGGYIKPRPAFSKINLILDAGVSLTGLVPQCAIQYDPDFGQESIVAQCGGRLLEFLPDTDGNAYVYDRSVRNYLNGIGFTSQQTNTTLTYGLTVQSLTDSSGATYTTGTSVTSDPAFLNVSSASVLVNPTSGGGGTIIYNFTLPLPAGYTAPVADGTQVLVGPPVSGQIHWTVMGVASGSIVLQFVTSGTASGFTYPANSPLFRLTNPTPPQVLAKTSLPFTAPAINGSAEIGLVGPYGGTVGDGIIIGNGVYLVTEIPSPQVNNTVVTQEVQTGSNNSLQFVYDLNDPHVRQCWMVQAENYVVVQDGLDRPIFYNGISSRRSVTATFVGMLEESFAIPRVGQTVTLTFSAPFTDAVGTVINIAPIGLYPFLMQVVALDVGGETNEVTAVNIDGQSAAGQTVAIGTPVNSTATPSYTGVLTQNLLAMPAPGSQVTISVTPPYTGVVGDQITLTDGTGPLTSYLMTVDQIQPGGLGLVVTSVNAPLNLIINAGYPIVSTNSNANELPIGKQMAYVQGRIWMALPSGKAFIAGDQVGDSSGSQALQFRDAVLKWSINTTNFAVPGEAGDINCIVALSAIDTSLGQGPLQILCDNDIFSCSAPDNAAQWATTTSPIVTESAIGFGGCGQDAAVVVNADLILKSNNGNVYSLKLARQDFNQWLTMPISQEMNRVIEQENLDLIQYLPFTEASNRALQGCSPIENSGVIFAQGLMALDYDVTSSLQGKLPPVWDGVWTGLNFMKLVSGQFNGQPRTFALQWNFGTNMPELWEILDDGIYDNGTTPITWSFETGVFFTGDNKYEPKRLEGGEIYVGNLVGKAIIKVWYRPDFDQCWHEWKTIQLCADNLTAAEQYRMRLGLGEPEDGSDPTVDKMYRDGRFFQVRFEITGSLTLMGGILSASQQTQPLYATVDEAEGAGVTPVTRITAEQAAMSNQQQGQPLVYYSNPDVIYQLDPNAEGLKPADPTKSCTAYSATGQGSFFGWNPETQTWN
jgi:hypothetical protein